MSNFSNIGFPVNTEDDLRAIIEKAFDMARPISANGGTYYLYDDPSGAQLWMQLDTSNNFIGCNPHYNGATQRLVSLTHDIPNAEHPLDGAYYAWANPQNSEDSESGDYPFVFDVPDKQTYSSVEFPQITSINLVGFSQDITVFEDVAAYEASATGDGPQFAAESFVPSGLFIPDDAPKGTPPLAYGILTGKVIAAEKKTNALIGDDFWVLQVETLGGPMDIVADPILLDGAPPLGGIVQTSVWLSGMFKADLKVRAEAKKKKRSWFRR